jgi:hypothetical protein
MEAFRANVEKIPGTPYYDIQRTVGQSERVQKVLGDVNDAQKTGIEELEQVTLNETSDNPGQHGDLRAVEQERRRQNLESVIGKPSQTEPKATAAMLQGFLNLPAPLVVVGAIFLSWGILYFPVACAVAGSTRSFKVMINPLVALETINRFAGKYVRFVLMSAALVLASSAAGVICAAVLAQFALTGFANLRAVAIGVVSGLCLWTVSTCVLGYTIFRDVDKLEVRN